MAGNRDDTERAVPKPSEAAAVPGVPAVGEVVASKYKVARVLGQGGMGIVVAAHHLELDTRVAIKFLRASLRDDNAVARFMREARAAAKITSEHVARVFDVGRLDSGAPYIVMEHLEGADLGARLRSQGPLSIEEAIESVLQACEALAEAHGLGIVHRDLKPANLFCTHRPDGLPWIKVLDFGISKVLSQEASEGGVTQSAVVMGSPAYMPPEQMRSSRDVDRRADIWALGVVLFELTSGQRPFRGEAYEMMARVANDAAPNLREVRKDCPEQLAAAVSRCLEKDREKRFADVAALSHALLPFAPARARVSVERIARMVQRERDGFTVSSEHQALRIEDPAALPAETLMGVGQTATRKRSPPVALLVLVSLIAAVLLLATWRTLGPGHSAPSVQPTGSNARPSAGFSLSVSSAPSPPSSNIQVPAPAESTPPAQTAPSASGAPGAASTPRSATTAPPKSRPSAPKPQPPVQPKHEDLF